MKAYYRKQKTSGSKAQAIVEFAIVLPILMMILVGIFEVGRLLFIYSAVTNASREAVRFGSALGYDDDGFHKYKHCYGIRAIAKRSAYFMNLQDSDIVINYDHGPGTSSFVQCDDLLNEEDANVIVNSGADQDRIQVTINASYNPLIRLIPIPSRTITSSSARTILGYVNVGSSSGGGGGGGSSTATATVTGTPPTSAPSNTPTATATAPTNTPTKTATSVPLSPTWTPLPSSTPSPVPTSTTTATPTLTTTSTPTITLTPTQTKTPTAVPGCGNITTGSITYSGNTMSLTITNQNATVKISSIQVTWNATTGHTGSDKTLILQSAQLQTTLATTIWSSLNNSTGTATLTPSSNLFLPGNNATSTVTFTFHQTYDKTNGTESITINFSTPGCSAIHKP